MIKTLDGKEWEQKVILKKMLDDEFYYGYLGEHALSSSSMKQILKDPLAYFSKEPMKETPALRQGRLIHLIVLEPEKINTLIFTEGTRASRVFKDACKENDKELVYTTAEYAKCKRVADAVTQDFEWFELVEGAEREVPAIKRIEGIPVRAKADIKHKTLISCDLKTTGAIDRFEDSIINFGYDLQGALYNEIFGSERFIIFIVDKQTLETRIRELTPKELAIGKEKYLKAIQIYKEWKQIK